MIACGTPGFSPTTVTVGQIASLTANARWTGTTDSAFCEDLNSATAQTGAGGTISTTGGSPVYWNGLIASFTTGTFWTQPTFVQACNNTPSSSSTSTQSCTIASPTAGDYYVGYCRSNSGPTSVTLTSSPANTFTGIGFQTTGSSGVGEGFYATSAASGSTTFTCTSNSSAQFQGINVMEFHPGSLTGIDTSNHNGITTSGGIWTSNSFTTASKGLIAFCADPLFGAGAWTPGFIGQNGSGWTPLQGISTSFVYCGYVKPGYGQASQTAAMKNAASGSWQGMVIAFK